MNNEYTSILDKRSQRKKYREINSIRLELYCKRESS